MERDDAPNGNPNHSELSYQRTNGPMDEMIDRLIEAAGGIGHEEIVREMILTALKAGREDNNRADMKLMNTTLKEMRFTAKVFSPYRNVKKVSVFGSARTKPDEILYEMAKEFGRKLVEAGYMVITGAGPGIMLAVNEGAGSDNSFGVTIRLPFEQEPNPILDGSPRNIFYKYFFNRKVAFLKESDAIALFPGGVGTLDEAMETLTLIQTGKQYPIPVILIDRPDGAYWSRLLEFVDAEMMEEDYIDKADLSLFTLTNSLDDAVGYIKRFYRVYHSMRYVRDKLILRLNSEIDPEKIEELKSRFSDILVHDRAFFHSIPLPEEQDEPEIAHLPRLVLDFNRRDFGRLRELIDDINGA